MPTPADRHIFVAYPWELYEDRTAYKRAYTTSEKALNVKFDFAEQRVSTGTVLEKIVEMIESAALGIYDVSGWNANVTLEYGVAIGLSSKRFIAFNPALTDAATFQPMSEATTVFNTKTSMSCRLPSRISSCRSWERVVLRSTH